MNARPRFLSGMLFAALALLAARTRAQAVSAPEGTRAGQYGVLATAFPENRSSTLPDKCGFPLLSEALRSRRTLAPAGQAALSALLQRGSFQVSVLTPDGRFRFHYDTTGIDVPALLDASGNRIPGTARAFVDSASAVITRVYQQEVVALGYSAPPSDGTLGGGPEYDIYIRNLGNLYGQTTPDNDVPPGGTSSSFIEIHNDFSFVTPAANRGIPALRVTLAHEFHHAIQVGSYAYWINDIWFHEITSVWMEDVVYHGVNDYLNYLFDPAGQFSSPGKPLTSNDFVIYSRGILGKYLTKRFGADMMRHVWENARSVSPLPALDLTLRQLPAPSSTTISVAFAEWVLWNYYTGPRADSARYYDEGRLFPLINETYYEMTGTSQPVSGSLPCLASDYNGFIAGVDTVTVALANVVSACPAGAQTSLPYTLTVSRVRPDNTYRSIPGNMFMKLDVADQSQWIEWAIGPEGGIASAAGEGSAYPNPFLAGFSPQVFFPANADAGTLSVFSSGMELVYSQDLSTQVRLGQRVFTWNGMTSRNTAAPTGIYIFVLTLPGRTVTGKLALVRR